MKPHKAVILIRVESHDVLSTGECSGQPTSADKLQEYGIRPVETFLVNGDDLDDCLRKVKEKIDVFR